MASVGRGDLACLIYTSGTGGAPRGVMQHHGAILHNVAAASTSSPTTSAGTTRSSSPSSPPAMPMSIRGGQYFPIALGAQIYYAESLEKLAANIEEVRPTIMVVVPRLFEMLRARIIKTIEKRAGCPIICCAARWRSARALRRQVDRRGTCRWTACCSLTLRKKIRAQASAGGSRRWCRAARRSTPKSACSSSRSG